MSVERIGRYEIRGELGEGGMATVLHGFDPRFKRDVAIKILPREMLFKPILRERFEREAQTIAALEHNAIVPVYDYGEEDGQPYLVMRHMTGGSLTDQIRQGALTLAETSRIISRIASALDKAHSRGIIHRDIKPSNILFDEEGSPYLSDFGIVKLSEANSQLTSGGIIGTPGYMAPEMARPGGLSPLVDVYALGVTIYQMLTGRMPYEADTPLGILMAHMNMPIPDIRDLRPDLPDAAQTLIEQAMAKDPADRYASAGELAAALQEITGGHREVYRPAAPVSSFAPTQDINLEPIGTGTRQPQIAAPTVGSNKLPLGIGAAVVTVVLVAAIAIGAMLLNGQRNPGSGDVTSAPSRTPPETDSEPTQRPTAAAADPPTDTPTETAVPIVAEPPAECAESNACVKIASSDPIFIGFAGPLSGDSSNFGTESVNALAIAVEDAGDYEGHPFEIAPSDDLGTPEGGVAVASIFAAEPQLVAVVGHMFSAPTDQALPIYEGALLPLVSPSASRSNLTQQGFTVFNRVSASDFQQGEVAAEFMQSLGVQRLAIMHDGSAYGQGLAERVRDVFTELGGELVAFQSITAGGNDYSTELNTVAGTNPDALFFGGYTGEGAVLALQRSSTGLGDITFVTGDGVFGDQYIDLAGSNSEGTYSLNLDAPPLSEGRAAFDGKYLTRFSHSAGDLSLYTWYTYDAFGIIAEAIRQVAIIDAGGNLYIPRRALIDAVRGTSEFQGITGEITCDETGECTAVNYTLYKVVSGEWIDQNFTPNQ